MSSTAEALRERAHNALQMAAQVNRIHGVLVVRRLESATVASGSIRSHLIDVTRLLRDAVRGMEWCEAVRSGSRRSLTLRSRPELDAYLVVYPAVRDIAGRSAAVARLKQLASVLAEIASLHRVSPQQRRQAATDLLHIAESAAMRGRQLLSSPELRQ